MSKYKLIGDYAIHDVSVEKVENTVTARMPLTTESSFMQHSIDKVLSDLKKNEVYPTEDGFDIIALAALVYLADTRISRSRHAEDSWMREIALELPVFNFEKWLPLGERKGEQLRSFQVAIKRIKDNPNLKNILIYKGGRLDGEAEYIGQLTDVYYRGLLEVDGFISAYLQYEKNMTEQ